jgi:DNA-binding transcriptional LysR family regulator
VDLRQLRTFVAIAEQGTVSRAAERLHIAQPALSRRIQNLEEEFGLNLFDRVRRRLVLTGEGEQLLGECRAILAAVASLGERAQALRRGDRGVLRVAATPQTIEGVFSRFLRQFARQRPNVQVKLTEAVGSALQHMVVRGEIHLAIGLRGALRDPHGLEVLELAPIEMLAACPPSWTAGARGEIEIARLAAHPLLLLDSSYYVRNTFDAACRLAGVQPEVFIESRAPHALLALAEAGHGIAIVPSVLPTSRYRLRVLRILHRRRALQESLIAFWDRERALPAYARDFREALSAYVRDVFPISRPRK